MATVQPGFRHARQRLAGHAFLRDGGSDWRTTLRDLSLSGLHVTQPDGFDRPVGHPLVLELRFGGPDSIVRLRLDARVARHGADAVGLRFERRTGLLERELQAVLDVHGEVDEGAGRTDARGHNRPECDCGLP
jgi:hypothetical protein